jgi:urea transport system substrate-binding protein
LYYPTFYKASRHQERHLYRPGATQQIIAGLDWVQKEKGAKTFYPGSDYIWPRTSNKIARKHRNFLVESGRREYFPLGHTQFNSVITDEAEQAGRDLRDHRRRPNVAFIRAQGGGLISTNRP